MNKDSTKIYRLRDKGIIVRDVDEYYEYCLESWMPEYRRYGVHLRLYAKYDPIRIFDDEFNMIKEVGSFVE